ncbi:hypothetical protein VTJ04DRAFT_6641 [Mycothermus thermophilus]|uniref:uncharacterized protein n=1 Tax=Humicola insolens TaxID=85995 RepID=UPI003742EC5F
MARPPPPPPPPQSVGFWEQFIKFGTDAYGLERLLRLLQALSTLLLLSSPVRFLFVAVTTNLLSLTTIITTTTTTSTSKPPAAPPSLETLTTLLPTIRTRLGAVRQALRFFRFLETFAAAWEVWTVLTSPPSPSPPGSGPGNGQGGRGRTKLQTAQLWADLFAKLFTGMYLLLESAVFVEVVLDVPPAFGVWGSQDGVREVVLQGQRFWFLGLVGGVVSGGLKVLSLGGGRQEGGKGKGEKEKEKGDKKVGGVGQVKKKDGNGRGKIVRRMVADVLDLGLPGSAVGWVPLGQEAVAWLMVGSTVLTGLEVWERCGRELEERKRRAAAASAGSR